MRMLFQPANPFPFHQTPARRGLPYRDDVEPQATQLAAAYGFECHYQIYSCPLPDPLRPAAPEPTPSAWENLLGDG